MRWLGSFVCFLVSISTTIADDEIRKNGWPETTRKVSIPSSKDGQLQPAVVYAAKSKSKRPLLVGLHTWSSGFSQGGGEVVYARWCIQNDWHFVHPHFRGPNNTPKAMGSDFAVQDILDSVAYMKRNHEVDPDRIYLIGVSGGGYASLLMAGRAPNIWAGVSAWCSISDIEKWWRFHAIKKGNYSPGRYAKHIEAAIGGRPDADKKLKQKCFSRSANKYLSLAKNVNLDINHGIHDGRKGSVPFTHSLEAFNRIAAADDQISIKQIQKYYATLKLPKGLSQAADDSLYKNKRTLFRRVSHNTRVTLFDGGHEIIHVAALNWLAQQRRGKPAKWEIEKVVEIASDEKESSANK